MGSRRVKPRPRRARINRMTAKAFTLAVTRRNTWARSASASIEFLEKLQHIESPHGQQWRDGMTAFYAKQLRAQLDNVPPGCERLARVIRGRLAKLA